MRQHGRVIASICTGVLGSGFAVGVAVGIAVTLPGSPAYAACTTSDNSATVNATPVPWPVQRYAPDRLANLADGGGVTVAVIDSGVDASHPSLRNHVAAGLDLLDGGNGQTDCVGHGTAVASIIAGQPLPGIGFRGLAPGAALVRQYWKGLSAREVVARLIATADPAPGSRRSNEYGYGVVNPYRAVTERTTSGAPARAAALPARSRDPAAEAAAAEVARTRAWALGVAGAGGVLTVLVILAATVLPRGRDRRWQPGPTDCA